MKPIMRIYAIVAVTIVLAGIVRSQVDTDIPEAPVAPVAPHTVSAPEPAFMDRLLANLPYARLGAASPPPLFVVPAREMTVEELTEISEDITVMGRILENRLRQANLLPDAQGLEVFVTRGYRAAFGRDGNVPPHMYLQGYGVVFAINVDLPLAPGPHVETEELIEPADESDPVWVRTREELYQPQRPKRRSAAEEAAPKYSAERLETLKTTIINTLVHAANMRHLSADEAMVVTITGPTTLRAELAKRKIVGGPQAGPEDWLNLLQGEIAGIPVTGSSTALTIRAKGSDIKALAQGDLTDEQFRQRVQVISHPVASDRGAGTVTTAIPPRSSGSR